MTTPDMRNGPIARSWVELVRVPGRKSHQTRCDGKLPCVWPGRAREGAGGQRETAGGSATDTPEWGLRGGWHSHATLLFLLLWVRVTQWQPSDTDASVLLQHHSPDAPAPQPRCSRTRTVLVTSVAHLLELGALQEPSACIAVAR